MNAPGNRKYVSPAREQRAAATRNRILDAAETLLRQKGFDGMTITSLAHAAQVAPQTVYALFISKTGIITALIWRVLGSDENMEAISQTETSDDPKETLRAVAKLMRSLMENSSATFSAIYGAGLVSSQLKQLEKELNDQRREGQHFLILKILASGRLLPHLDEESARDVLWALTSRELYHLLVNKRNWPPERYERHLHAMLVGCLLQPCT